MRKSAIILSLLVMCCIQACSHKENNQEKTSELIVGTYNLRMDTPDDKENAWPHRKELVNKLIRFHEFDIFGTQEGFKHQLNDIVAYGDYERVGKGRDGEDEGEHSAIFYKKNRLQLLEQGDFWFSETPEQVGKGWDATCCNRICSWGKFKDKISDKVFYFFSLHYDHEGVVARRESSKLLLRKIKEIAGDMPTITVGDFNATPDEEPIQIIANDGLLRDAYQITEQPPYGTLGTFHAYRHDHPLQDRIDYIFVTSGIKVLKYGVLNEKPYGRFPSDHFPVMAKVQF